MTPQQTTVRIWWDTQVQAYRMLSSYNADLVDTFKKQIPVSDRSYDGASKIWTFVERQLQPTLGLMQLLGVKVQCTTRQQAEQAQQAQQASASGRSPTGRNAPTEMVAVEFFRVVPYTAMQKAYRAAQMELHPDRQGGNGDASSRLNAAWDRLKKEFYKDGAA